MLTKLRMIDFLQQTASGTPLPGGGSVSALSAALGASLTEMVANLTVGKTGYQTVEKEMQEIAETAKNLREHLLAEVDNDSNAYNDVLAAFKLPKATAKEKEQRSEAIQQALKMELLYPIGLQY